ncbi:MAG: ADP-ribose polymerase [Bacteroidota bacterium]
MIKQLLQKIWGGNSSASVAHKTSPLQAQPLTFSQPIKTPDGNAMKKVDGNPGLRVAKLIMVTAKNNNKFYEMEETADGMIRVSYGRVGSPGTFTTYPAGRWKSLYNSKVRKGYKDQTQLFAQVSKDFSFADIDDAAVQELINALMRYAKKSIQRNYVVSAEDVTALQVEAAQKLLDGLVKKVKMKMDVTNFNEELLDLYQVIPRRMHNVRDHLLQGPPVGYKGLAVIREMLSEEQSTLDVMRSQVELNGKQQSAMAKEESINLLEAMGLQIETEEDPKMIKQIKKLMGPHSANFAKAYKVNNIRTRTAFDAHLAKADDQKLELFWHGSRNENWMSILETGLVLRPANAVINGKMFGYGLYFADKFKKSLNYTSLRGSYWAGGTQGRGYLALFDVHVGRQYKIKKHQSWCYELNEKNLKKKGAYDSLYARGGADLVNNEYIVYNQAQCTVRYLVEVK